MGRSQSRQNRDHRKYFIVQNGAVAMMKIPEYRIGVILVMISGVAWSTIGLGLWLLEDGRFRKLGWL
jgi:hypothetical protein